MAVYPGTYRDSLLLMSATRAMADGPGVSWASAVMATPAAVEDLGARGFAPGDLAGADANALVLAVRAADDPAAADAVERGRAAVFAEAASPTDEPGRPAPRTVGEAAARLPAANVAVVSVPGPYAAVAAHSALSAGLHVLLFSDNVPLAEEVELKERARRLGLLLMGPGAGTAVLAGVGLGFANAVTPGPVGVVAAAGTGAQEVMSLLDRWDIGVSQVIGVGGRDLSSGVGGLMAAEAVRALDADPGTEVILLVSKPPDPDVARTVIGASKATPVVAACLGMSAPDGRIGNALLADTLEQGARRVAGILGLPVPGPGTDLAEVIERVAARMPDSRRAVRGFFTGGTLCYEAQVVLTRALGPVYSNIPLRPDLGLPAPAGAHVCLDLGEEEYTKGRPHPMIDPAARTEIMRAEAFDHDIAAVLLDVVIGYGSHSDPAGEIAGTCADIVASGATVIAYVLGARADRQGFDRQRRTLRDAGAIVTASAAEAARVAAAVAAAGPPWPPRGARDGAIGDGPAGTGRPGHLLGQAARRCGPHRSPGRGAARGRVPGPDHRARRSRRGLLPSRPGAGHDHPRPAAPADPGGTGLRQRRRAGRGPGPPRGCLPRPAHPGLHLSPCRLPGQERGSYRPPGRRAHRPPRRRLHQPLTHRVPAPGHPGAGPDPGRQRALAGTPLP